MSYAVTGRDITLFSALDSYGLLSTGQIKKLFFQFQHRSVVSRRLCKLQKRKFLRATTGLPKGELVWRLTPKASKLVGSRDVIKSINKNTLGHDVLVSDIRIQFEKHKLGSSWRSAHEIIRMSNSPQYVDKDLIPDWFFKLHGKKKGFICALEVELHLKSASRVENTFKSYSRKEGYDLVWYFVPSVKMGQSLVRQMHQHYSSRKGHWFLYSMIGDLEKDLSELKVYHKNGSYVLSEICEITKLEELKVHKS